MRHPPQQLILVTLILVLAGGALGIARRGQYDEEAREEERIAKVNRQEARQEGSAAQNFAQGVKDIASAPGELIGHTAEGTMQKPGVGTLEGVQEGSGEMLDKAVKGTVRVATLGFGNVKSYEVEEPKAGTNETTKIKIKIPGT